MVYLKVWYGLMAQDPKGHIAPDLTTCILKGFIIIIILLNWKIEIKKNTILYALGLKPDDTKD